jgi:hypothetical protein
MKKTIVAVLVSLLLMPAMAMGAEYAGVGLVCNTYGETVAQVKDITVMDVLSEMMNKDTIVEGKPLCVNYGIYNPFDIKLDTSLVFTGEIKELMFDLEPDVVTVDPAINELPEQAIPVKACFRVQTKYPYEPKKYRGSTTAEWRIDSSGGGTGSATGGSVECPFILQANTERGQEIMLQQREQAIFKLQVLMVVVIAAIVLLVVLFFYRRKKKKEWETNIRNVCTKCRKQYPLSVEHCPKCGSKLKKFKAGREV